MPSNSEPVSENEPAPHTQEKATKKPKTAKPKVPRIPAPLQSDGQKAPYHCEITCKAQESWWERVKPLVEIAGVILLTVYTWYTIKMYCANKEAADAAKDAAVVAQKELMLSERPWIGITFPNLDRTKEFSKDGPGTIFSCPIKISNYGKTPARMVEIHAICSLLMQGIDRPDLGPSGPSPHIDDVFEFIQPGETNNRPIPAAIVLNGKATAIPGTEELWYEVANGKFTVIVYGNLTYKDSFSRSHWTHFCHA
jgi:hypothetical protein